MPKFTIESAESLFAALHSPDCELRGATLREIARNPVKAVGYGPHRDTSLFQQLLALHQKENYAPNQVLVLLALATFSEPEVAPLLLQELSDLPEPDVIHLCRQRLGMESRAWRENNLQPLLLETSNLQVADCLAQLLADCELASESAIRCHLFDCVPEVGWDSALWRRELSGPFRAQARPRVPDSAWEDLLRVFHADDRAWLLEWGARRGDIRAHQRVLADSDAAGQLEALRQLGKLQGLEPLLAHLAAPGNPPEVRLAALRALPEWPEELAVPEEPELRAEFVRKNGDADYLCDSLKDDSWEVRAVAVDRLVSLGSSVADQVTPYLEDEFFPARTAAAQVLLRLGLIA